MANGACGDTVTAAASNPILPLSSHFRFGRKEGCPGRALFRDTMLVTEGILQSPRCPASAPRRPPGRSYLQVPVDHGAAMHVFQPKDDLGGVEAHLLLRKDPVLGEVVVQVST